MSTGEVPGSLFSVVSVRFVGRGRAKLRDGIPGECNRTTRRSLIVETGLVQSPIAMLATRIPVIWVPVET